MCSSDLEAVKEQVLEGKCGACHTNACASGDCFAATWSETQKWAGSCGKPMYQCMLDRVLNGSMPSGKGCTGDPVFDGQSVGPHNGANSYCLNAYDLQLLKDWVDRKSTRLNSSPW